MRKSIMTPTPNLSDSTPVAIIIEIILLIIKLIFSGKSETDAINIASKKHNIPVDTVKSIWKNRK